MLNKLKILLGLIPKQETVAQEALRLLSSIPKKAFMTGDFGDGVGKCCAIGHYIRLKSDDPNDFSRENCSDFFAGKKELRKTSIAFLGKVHGLTEEDLAAVNNSDTLNGYNEPEIKDRVIHCLKDMVKHGY